MQIQIIGDIFGSTGYASHVRQLSNALSRQGADVRIDSTKPVGWESQVNDAELNMLTKDVSKDRTDVCINLPHTWAYHLSARPKHFVGCVIWEGNKIPEFWLKHLADERVNAIICPSSHTRQAIFNTDTNLMTKPLSAIDNKIRLVPHGVDQAIFNYSGPTKNKKCTFFANKGWTNALKDRGGLQYIIKAFAEEFSKKDKVKLLVKINKVYAPNFNVLAAIKQLGIKQPKKDRAQVMITETDLPYNRLPELYHQGDCFVSASMGEAFNIPVIEAMSCGLPAIVTNVGGHCDFVNKSNGWKVKSTPYLVKDDFQYEGISWAKISQSELRKTMRNVYNLWKKDGLKIKSKGALRTAKRYSWDNAAKKLIEIIDNL